MHAFNASTNSAFTNGSRVAGACASSQQTKRSDCSKLTRQSKPPCAVAAASDSQGRTSGDSLGCARGLDDERWNGGKPDSTRHAVDRVDVMSVDTEGWDYRVIRQLDFSRYRPKLIRCEYINLDDEEKAVIGDLFAANDYVIRIKGQNIDAVPTEYWREVLAAQ